MTSEPKPFYHWEGGRFPGEEQGVEILFENEQVYVARLHWPYSRTRVTEKHFLAWGFHKVESKDSIIARLEWRVAQLEERMREVGNYVEDELRRSRGEEW